MRAIVTKKPRSAPELAALVDLSDAVEKLLPQASSRLKRFYRDLAACVEPGDAASYAAGGKLPAAVGGRARAKTEEAIGEAGPVRGLLGAAAAAGRYHAAVDEEDLEDVRGAYLEERLGEWAATVVSGQAAALKEARAVCRRREITPADTADVLVAVAGLSARDAASVANQQAELAKHRDRFSAASIGKNLRPAVARRINGLLDRRAYLTADFELARAYNGGKRLAHVRALRIGLVSSVTRRWVTQLDGDVCFPAGTVVSTPRGEVPIQAVAPGMEVSTPAGPRRVLAVSARAYAEDATAFWTERGVLVATGNHPVWANGEWTEARRLKGGDRLKTAENETVEIRGVLDFRLGETDGPPALLAERAVLSSIPDRVVPVGPVYFEGDASVGQGEVDRVAPDSVLLDKADAGPFEGLPDAALQPVLAPKAAVAGEATEHRVGTGDYAEGCPTRSAFPDLGRPPAFFGAVGAIVAPVPGEDCTASFASDVAGIGVPAGLRTERVAGRIGAGDGKGLAAPGTNLLDRRGGTAAFAATEPVRSLGGPVGRDKHPLAVLANRPGDLAGSGVVTGGGAESASGCAPLEALEALSAVAAIVSEGHALYLDGIISEVAQSRSLTVHNIQVEGEECYYANGVLVHNCQVCGGLHGKELVASGNPRSLYNLFDRARKIADAPAHMRCRCTVVYETAGAALGKRLYAKHLPGQHD